MMLINNMEELRKNLIELRQHYFTRAKEIMKEYPDEDDLTTEKAWELGKAHGGLEVADALILSAFGGRELSRLMEMSWEAAAIADELELGEEDDDED